MEIIKKGKEFGPVPFVCPVCSCEFICNRDEYEIALKYRYSNKRHVGSFFSGRRLETQERYFVYRRKCQNCGTPLEEAGITFSKEDIEYMDD